jgi:hypothetical protein
MIFQVINMRSYFIEQLRVKLTLDHLNKLRSDGFFVISFVFLDLGYFSFKLLLEALF